MNRRGFLNTFIGGIAASAAVRTFPFRVFSFPSEIAAPERMIDDQFISNGRVDFLDMRYWGITYEHDVNLAAHKYLGLSRSSYPGRLNA